MLKIEEEQALVADNEPVTGGQIEDLTPFLHVHVAGKRKWWEDEDGDNQSGASILGIPGVITSGTAQRRTPYRPRSKVYRLLATEILALKSKYGFGRPCLNVVLGASFGVTLINENAPGPAKGSSEGFAISADMSSLQISVGHYKHEPTGVGVCSGLEGQISAGASNGPAPAWKKATSKYGTIEGGVGLVESLGYQIQATLEEPGAKNVAGFGSAQAATGAKGGLVFGVYGATGVGEQTSYATGHVWECK